MMVITFVARDMLLLVMSVTDRK